MVKIGDLVIIKEAGYRVSPKGQKQKLVEVKCFCSKVFTALRNNIIRKHTKSCGCLQPPGYHGLRDTPIYRIWDGMMQRCGNANTKAYENYGGRGIKVCDEWKNFQNFYSWCVSNGWGKGLQLDRINNDSNYEPSNCRFVTRSENNRNKRTNKLIEYNGQTKTVTEWCEIYGLNFKTLHSRIFVLNWPIEKALTKKVNNVNIL